MGILTKQFGTDTTKEIEGVWAHPLGEGEDLPAFKLSRMGKSNKRYTKALDKAIKPHRRLLELEMMPDEQADQISREVFARGVLLDWRNVSASDLTGDDDLVGIAPFTPENALVLFERLPDLYLELESRARKASAFRADEVERDSGN